MKVLHIIGSLEIGGAQRLVSDLLPLLSETNEVELLVCEPVNNMLYDYLKQNRIKVNCLNCKQQSPKVIFLLIPWIKRSDVVHVHLFPLLYWAAFASLFVHCKLVYTEHSTNNRRRGNAKFCLIERFVYSRFSRIISISHETQIALQQWLHSTDERFVTIQNGINLTRFLVDSKSTRKKQILMISRFAPAKDHMTVIRAMKYIDKSYHVAFVGDGETFDQCKQLAEEEGVTNRIKFMGSKENVVLIIAESMIGVQSSFWEGFGLTAIEMMAGGLPIIASNVKGLNDVVEGAGLLFDKGDEKNLAEVVNSLISNAELYEKVKEKCFERSLCYSIEKTASLYSEIYKKTCKSKEVYE